MKVSLLDGGKGQWRLGKQRLPPVASKDEAKFNPVLSFSITRAISALLIYHEELRCME